MRETVEILVVDDRKENHLVIESILSDEPVVIVKAHSGEEALALCTDHDFALILMDVQMPGMDGFETAELLRGIKKTRQIPIVFVTAISKEKKSVFRGYEVGAVDYLFKPIDPIVLKSKVRVFCDLYRQRRTIERQRADLERKIRELTEMREEKEALESISLEDPLTKIYNRRGVEQLLEGHFGSCMRYQLNLSVILFDIDHFKNYNDHYGHIAGDEVLRKLAAHAKDVLYRPEDFIGRYGGEEFIIVLPNTDHAGALEVAERVQKDFDTLDLKHEYNESFGRVTVSMGVVTTIPQPGDEPEMLVNLADRFMYEAKRSGRNRIVSEEVELIEGTEGQF
jgi:diguanylate cyclase (GGDEF)-like protein